MQLFYVYVLKSIATGSIYTGQTSNIERRLQEHNNPASGKYRYTRRHEGPWEFIYSEQYESRSEAVTRERFLKSGQGRQWLKDQLTNLNRQGS